VNRRTIARSGACRVCCTQDEARPARDRADHDRDRDRDEERRASWRSTVSSPPPYEVAIGAVAIEVVRVPPLAFRPTGAAVVPIGEALELAVGLALACAPAAARARRGPRRRVRRRPGRAG